LQVNEEKLDDESAWDGLVGIMTNNLLLTEQQVLEQYCGLWQVEDSFRISKHDLRIRPIYHWTPKRVKAHIAISFIALTCVRYLSHRLKIQYKKISPEQIKTALLAVQASVIKDRITDKKYLLPSAIDIIAKNIYRVLAIPMPQKIVALK
jgi:transposase